jgi:hypothetical protein
VHRVSQPFTLDSELAAFLASPPPLPHPAHLSRALIALSSPLVWPGRCEAPPHPRVARGQPSSASSVAVVRLPICYCCSPTLPCCPADPRLTGTSSSALQFGCCCGEAALVRPRSSDHRPSSRVGNLVSIGFLVRSSWVSGGRRGGSVPVGATPERAEVSRDLPVAKASYARGLRA